MVQKTLQTTDFFFFFLVNLLNKKTEKLYDFKSTGVLKKLNG